MITVDPSGTYPFLSPLALDQAAADATRAHRTVLDGSGPGAEFLGWRELLLAPDPDVLADIQQVASEIREKADVFVSVGIGGSYLGAQAVMDAVLPYFPRADRGPEIVFAGTQMSGAYLGQLLAHLEGKSVYLNVISKSGTTLEPAITFRFIRSWMEQRFHDADSRIVVTTDPDRGALNAMRSTHSYRKFVIPPSVGGRFSVLSPVGLLPIAVAGIDVAQLFQGAMEQASLLSNDSGNAALSYAATRIALMRAGYGTEILATFEPRFSAIGSWWQQLFGESEGKSHTGLLPVSVRYSTDLHSLGQYVQDGKRNLIETFLMVENDEGSLRVGSDDENLDGLNYLAGKSMSEINRKAYQGTARAHQEGGVPVTTIWIPDVTAMSVGRLIYFFQHAVAVGGYMLGLNPFDQPGVEAYKREMFALLGRP